MPALEMTTREVLGGLQAAGVEEDLRADLRAFLDQCDLVKFAKVEPGAEASRSVLESGRAVVRRSAPRGGEPAPSGPGGAPPAGSGAGAEGSGAADEPAPAEGGVG